MPNNGPANGKYQRNKSHKLAWPYILIINSIPNSTLIYNIQLTRLITNLYTALCVKKIRYPKPEYSQRMTFEPQSKYRKLKKNQRSQNRDILRILILFRFASLWSLIGPYPLTTTLWEDSGVSKNVCPLVVWCVLGC